MQYVAVLALAIYVFVAAYCELTERPKDQEKVVGDDVSFSCTTTMNSSFKIVKIGNSTTNFSSPVRISNIQGLLVGIDKSRYSVTNNGNGRFTLRIRNTTVGDSGVYACSDQKTGGAGEIAFVRITVFEQQATTSSHVALPFRATSGSSVSTYSGTTPPISVSQGSTALTVAVPVGIIVVVVVVAVVVATIFVIRYRKRRRSSTRSPTSETPLAGKGLLEEVPNGNKNHEC